MAVSGRRLIKFSRPRKLNDKDSKKWKKVGTE